MLEQGSPPCSHRRCPLPSILLPLAHTKHCEAPAPRTLHEHFFTRTHPRPRRQGACLHGGRPTVATCIGSRPARCPSTRSWATAASRSLGFAYPGDLIGLGACNDHRMRCASHQATQLRSVPWNTAALARQDPALGMKLYEAISEELAAAHDLLADHGPAQCGERVATFLIGHGRRCRRTGQTQPSSTADDAGRHRRLPRPDHRNGSRTLPRGCQARSLIWRKARGARARY